jgi:nucleoside-diphosphate kinase
MPGAERTLLVFKPDAVKRGLVGRIAGRLEDAGLKIVAAKMKVMDADFTKRHYFDLAERRGESVYNATATFMTSGPVIALVLEGAEAVSALRRLVGATIPSEAAPGTIRGDFAHVSKAYSSDSGRAVANLVHASGNPEEAALEVSLWFSPDELHAYDTGLEAFTQ